MNSNVPMCPARSAPLSQSNSVTLCQDNSATLCMNLSVVGAMRSALTVPALVVEVGTALASQAVLVDTDQRRKRQDMGNDQQMNNLLGLEEHMETQELKDLVEDPVVGLGVAQVDHLPQVVIMERFMVDHLDQATEAQLEVEEATVKVSQDNNAQQYKNKNARVFPNNNAEL